MNGIISEIRRCATVEVAGLGRKDLVICYTEAGPLPMLSAMELIGATIHRRTASQRTGVGIVRKLKTGFGDRGLSLGSLRTRNVRRRAIGYVVGTVRARWALRTIGGRGGGVRVNGGLVVENDGQMSVGPGSVLRGIPTAVELASGPDGHLQIGRRCVVNSGASICAYGHMVIGDRVLIGPNVMINDTSFHELYERDVVPEPVAVVIEDDVWIGAKASILPGVTIGRGAVVSAHSLVQRDVAAFTIVAGVPAAEVAKLNPKKFVVRDSPASGLSS